MSDYTEKEIEYIKKKIETLNTKYDTLENRVSKVEWKLDAILTTSQETNRMIKQAIIGAVVMICVSGIAGLIWTAVTTGSGGS